MMSRSLSHNRSIKEAGRWIRLGAYLVFYISIPFRIMRNNLLLRLWVSHSYGILYFKKSSTEAVKKMNGQAAADACIAPHNSTATVYLQMVVASSERPRTDCKKCNHRGAATANWRPHSKRPKEDFEWKRPKKKSKSSKNLRLLSSTQCPLGAECQRPLFCKTEAVREKRNNGL